jgi:CheY-like chemotaxis protein
MMTPHTIARKRILLVDDEPMVRQTLKLMLTLDQWTVVEAENGLDGCRSFTPGEFDVVITDYAMHGMKGDELARAIKCLVPSQPIIMISAYIDQLRNSDIPVDALLSKPCSIADLRRAIAEVLSAKRSLAEASC